jgi:predicted RNase H-like HicB family nuclease
MKFVYPAIFHKEDKSYWVEFPDLEGCQTYGDNLPQAIELASEALGLYLASRLDNGLKINNPSDIMSIEKDADSFVSYVASDASKYRNKNKAVKKTLTIPGWLNEEAEKRHVNFSGVLQNALVEHLNMNH